MVSGLSAHPGIGIVRDLKGNIFYTDLRHVWKVNSSGEKIIAVKDVHTHELFIDADDNLYGEHLWYNGEQLNTWGHYVWCLKNSGDIVKVVEPTDGFLNNYSFVRDLSGNMYWVERFTVSRFMKKSPDGNIMTVGSGKFEFVSWLHATADGTIYFTEGNKLHRLNPDGTFSLLVPNLGSKAAKFSITGRNYDDYGIWTDRRENIYIAMISARKIQRVTKDGTVSTIYNSNNLWIPCSGVFDDNGNMWILEYSITNEGRVRKLDSNMLGVVEQGSSSRKLQLSKTIAITSVIIVIVFFTRSLLLKKRGEKIKKRELSVV